MFYCWNNTVRINFSPGRRRTYWDLCIMISKVLSSLKQTWNRKTTEGRILMWIVLMYIKEVLDEKKVQNYIVGIKTHWFPKVQVTMLICFCPLKSFLFYCLSQLRLSGGSTGLEMHVDELAPQSPFWSLNVIAFKLGFYFFSCRYPIFETNFLETSFSPWWKNRFSATSLLPLRY